MMKLKQLLILLLVVGLPMVAIGQSGKVKKANAETEKGRYEIEAVSVGTQGNVVIKVWSFSKKPEVATEQSRKNAVHGVIFKGVPGKDRIPGKKPLVENSAKESEFADFFKAFFADGGDYMRFVTLTNSGAIAAGDLMKTSNKEYKVGVSVTVNYNELRSHLEKNGVIRKLDSGF